MSSQKGNLKKSGPPRHKNNTAFRNNLHDNSAKQKMINSLEITGLCDSCTKVIEWKIKYKKYKPLTNPKTCAFCSKKSIKRAYHLICLACAEHRQVCPKCAKTPLTNGKIEQKSSELHSDAECTDSCSDDGNSSDCCSDDGNKTQESCNQHIKSERVCPDKSSVNVSENRTKSSDTVNTTTTTAVAAADAAKPQTDQNPLNIPLSKLSVSKS